MAIFLNLLSIGIGSLLILVRLLMIAPQVRVHKIRICSIGSGLFRIGIILTVLGIVVRVGSDLPGPFTQAGQLMGITDFLGGVITAGHEYRQANENNQVPWDWPHSLTLQMLLMGGITLALASAALQ